MSHSPFNDPRAARLLARVGDDLSQLRRDIGTLISHTTHRTVPDGAKEIAETARHQLLASRDYAASRLRALREVPPRDAISVAGGLVLIGLLALGIHSICRNKRSEEAMDEDHPL